MGKRGVVYAAIPQVWAGAARCLSDLHRSIPLKAFPGLFALLLLASMACSLAGGLSNGGGFQEVSGPILAVVTAASLDAQGRVINQSTSFPPTTPQMTVVVQVGQLASPSSLTVAWYSVGEAGDVKLFEHTIQVDPLDRAFSVGQNPGVLATGTYRAVATLGSATQTTTWTVAEVQAPPSSSTSPTSNAAQTKSGKPPTSGASGKVPAPQGASPQTSSATGCNPLLEDPFQIPPNIAVGVGTGESIPTCAPLGELQLQVQIGNNPPSTACSFTTTPTTYTCLSTGDPCLLSGGSDLPGTVFNTSLRQKNGGQVLATNSITFYPDTIPPRVTLVTQPSNGVKVKAGDKIQLTGIAEEIKDAGWQTGVSKIEVWQTAPTAEQEGVETYNSYVNKACGAKSWKQTTKTVTYTVPKNPPPQITFCAYGTDFAGNEARSDNCATFYTGLFTIKGSLEYHRDVTNPAVTGFAHDKEDMVAQFVASGQPDNTMKGTVQATFVQTVEVVSVVCSTKWTTGNLNWTAVLSGTFQKNSDGSLTVILNPTPQKGPQYPSGYCPPFGPPSGPSLLPNMGGTLVNGKYDYRQDYPVPTGYDYVTLHIELVTNP